MGLKAMVVAALLPIVLGASTSLKSTTTSKSVAHSTSTARSSAHPTTTAKVSTTLRTTTKASTISVKTSSTSVKTSSTSIKSSSTSVKTSSTSVKPSTASSKPSSTSSKPAASSSAAAGPGYLITFGDSYSQTGFNVTLAKPSAANPLGNPGLPGYTASGGLNWVGMLVSEYNTSEILSYNFAYGGATTSAALVTPYEPTVLSFVDQVAEFESSIASHPSYAPWTADNTIVGVWIGVNDVGNTWYQSNVTAIINDIMAVYFANLQIVYQAGARNFFLLSVPPIDQTPVQLAGSVADQQAEAAIITQYNAALATNLASFKAANSDAKAIIVNTSVDFYKAIDNPTAYGAPNASCFDSSGTACLWFNNYHPGIAINQLVAQDIAAQLKSNGFPFN